MYYNYYCYSYVDTMVTFTTTCTVFYITTNIICNTVNYQFYISYYVKMHYMIINNKTIIFFRLFLVRDTVLYTWDR